MTMPPSRKPGRPKDACNAQRRCAEILEVAIRHFAEAGYAGADLEQFAADIGCAKGTIFRYFPTKRALFEAAVDHVMQEFLRETRPPAGVVGLEFLREAFRRTLGFFDAHPDYVELLIQERAVFKDRERPSFFEYLENSCEPEECPVKEMVKQGVLRDVEEDAVFDMVSRLIYGTIFTNYFIRRKKSHQQQADEIIDIVFHGIVRPDAPRVAVSTASPRSNHAPAKRAQATRKGSTP